MKKNTNIMKELCCGLALLGNPVVMVFVTSSGSILHPKSSWSKPKERQAIAARGRAPYSQTKRIILIPLRSDCNDRI
ncbi:MAG: hypothetical protein LBB05_03915 [Puniceicoccales bacterium]|nr:hypothetical protein [Puniceicoccales bacterium]